LSLRSNGSRECAPDDRLREAIHSQSNGDNGLLCRFAPRNDGKHSSAFSRRDAPELCTNHARPELMRAWGMPGAHRTRSLACEINKAHERSHHRYSRIHPAFPHAMVLTAYFVLSPVTGLSCHRRCTDISANLTPASGRQDHTTSPSARPVCAKGFDGLFASPPKL
jgi:hypothetical protein